MMKANATTGRRRLLAKLHAIGVRIGLGHEDLSAMARGGSLAIASDAELQNIIDRLLTAYPDAATIPKRVRPRGKKRPAGVVAMRTPKQLAVIEKQLADLRSLGWAQDDLEALAMRTIGRPSFLDARTVQEGSASINGLNAVLRWVAGKGPRPSAVAEA